MKTRVWISEMTFSDDTTLQFDKDDIVVFVGPNNAGKSASLKEAASLLRSKKIIGKVLKDITIDKVGEVTDLLDDLTSNSTVDKRNPYPYFNGFGYSIYEPNVSSSWENHTNGLGDLERFYVNSISTEDRLKAANPAQNIKITTEPIKHPIHYLQKYDSIEQKFSDYFRLAFGTDLIVHRNAGSVVPLYVGTRPPIENGEDRLSASYLAKIEKLDLLQEQGDGMRSFVGVLLNASISNHSILFIDEPEAFLHPPQARLMGKMLAHEIQSTKQLFLSTHSEDFLKGLLDANISNLKIIRIQREGSINRVSSLTSDDIKKVWDDSFLRHSNVLNGLFHSGVIICESDSDCRFYSALLSTEYDGTDSVYPSLLFIHCGGKHKMPKAITALKKLNVPIKVVADFDVLNDINPIKNIYEELGGDWKEIKKDWSIVKSHIDDRRPELLTVDVKKEIDSIIGSVTDRNFPKEKIKEIREILSKTSAWSEAKKIGKQYIPNGDASISFGELQHKLKEKGLFVLEVGELEGFCKSAIGHGPKWVSDVLTKDLKNDPELEEARQFVKLLVKPEE